MCPLDGARRVDGRLHPVLPIGAMAIAVTLLDAFTDDAGAGNRAGVVVDAASLSERVMRAVARAVGASETAFVVSSTTNRSIRVRFFTPTTEIPFCGHATVATFVHLARIGAIDARGEYALECGEGAVPIQITEVLGGPQVWMTTPQEPWTSPPIELDEILAALRLDSADVDRSLPVRRAGRRVVVPVRTRQAVDALGPRWDELVRIADRHGIGDFIPMTRDVLEPGSTAHIRVFCPLHGINEDPATGSANGPLAMYLVEHGVIALREDGGVVRARVEQGDAMRRPSRLELEIVGRPGAVERIRVGGVAKTVITGFIDDAVVPPQGGLG